MHGCTETLTTQTQPHNHSLSLSSLDTWIKATEEGPIRAEAVRRVSKEVQKQLEKLEVGHSSPPQSPHQTSFHISHFILTLVHEGTFPL